MDPSSFLNKGAINSKYKSVGYTRGAQTMVEGSCNQNKKFGANWKDPISTNEIMGNFLLGLHMPHHFHFGDRQKPSAPKKKKTLYFSHPFTPFRFLVPTLLHHPTIILTTQPLTHQPFPLPLPLGVPV